MNNRRLDQVREESMTHYGFGPHVMQSLKVCRACGKVLPAGEQFCTECGKPLPEKNLYQSYKERHICCRACETVLADSAEYCPQCGEKI